MKAIYVKKYGNPENAYITTIPIPKINDDEILIQIKASTINSADSRIRSLDVPNCFLSFIIRMIFGFSGPRNPILGTNGSGIVTSIGGKVKSFKINDEVFFNRGSKMGCHSEYISIKENDVVISKPSNITHNEAASLIFGSNTALYFLSKTKIKHKENLNVLLYGATSSTGCSAIQICKYFKSKVTAVCSTDGIELVKSLGSDRVIDYKKDDFTKENIKYDIIFDCVGKISKKTCKACFVSDGEFISVDSFDIASDNKDLLIEIKRLIENNHLKAVIDRCYNMNSVVEAYKYVDSGRKKGNVVLEI